MKRRTVLLGTPALLTGLAGCSLFSSQSPMLDVNVINHADSPYTTEIAFFRVDNPSRSDARVYDASIDVKPDGETTRENVATSQRYLVRYEAYKDNSKLTDEDHVHYYPPDTGDDESLTFDIDSTGVLTHR